MKITVKRLSERVNLPVYQTEHSAGMDLAACIDEPVVIAPHGRAVIPTGIAIALPEGCEAQIRGRSGLAAKFGVMPANGVGTIDADYGAGTTKAVSEFQKMNGLTVNGAADAATQELLVVHRFPAAGRRASTRRDGLSQSARGVPSQHFRA